MCRYTYRSDGKESPRLHTLTMTLEIDDAKTAERLAQEIISLTQSRYKGIVSFEYFFHDPDNPQYQHDCKRHDLEFILEVKTETYGQVDAISNFIIYAVDTICLGGIPECVDDSIVSSVSMHSS